MSLHAGRPLVVATAAPQQPQIRSVSLGPAIPSRPNRRLAGIAPIAGGAFTVAIAAILIAVLATNTGEELTVVADATSTGAKWRDKQAEHELVANDRRRDEVAAQRQNDQLAPTETERSPEWKEAERNEAERQTSERNEAKRKEVERKEAERQESKRTVAQSLAEREARRAAAERLVKRQTARIEYERGYAAYKNGELTVAEDAFRHALAADSTHPEARRYLALVQRKSRDPQDAARARDSSKPRSRRVIPLIAEADGQFQIGYAAFKRGDVAAARAAFLRALAADPEHLGARRYLGLVSQ